MLSFDEFASSFTMKREVRDNPVARYIYESIVWREDVRIRFADASDMNVPALSVCVKEIEDYCSVNGLLDLESNTVKQIIGRMVAAAIEPLGYKPARRTRIPMGSGSRFFSSAQVYEFRGKAKERIERRIVEITESEE